MLTLPDGDELQPHEDWIKAETLATRIELGDVLSDRQGVGLVVRPGENLRVGQ